MAQVEFTKSRKAFHQALLKTSLSLDAKGTPSIADGSNKTSIKIAQSIVEQLGNPKKGKKIAGQSAGDIFESNCCAFLGETFLKLGHLRPGKWQVFQVTGRRGSTCLTGYEQYSHLDDLMKIAKEHPEIVSAIGSDYIISPDVLIVREPEPDSEINRSNHLVDDEIAQLTSIRAANESLPNLHASISCKWTIRSDRAQNARSEALNLIRSRKGRVPHMAVVTAEPLPSRLSSLAMGTGDIDCVYHFALPELQKAVEEHGNDDTIESLSIMIQGKRLRDISDLPLDLVI